MLSRSWLGSHSATTRKAPDPDAEEADDADAGNAVQAVAKRGPKAGDSIISHLRAGGRFSPVREGQYMSQDDEEN